MVKVDRRIRWHYTTTILRIGARLTRYRNCKFHNFARTISRHADGISRYSVPPSAGPLLPLGYLLTGVCWYARFPVDSMRLATLTVSPKRQYLGIVTPTTPPTTDPLCRPQRIVNLRSGRCAIYNTVYTRYAPFWGGVTEIN